MTGEFFYNIWNLFNHVDEVASNGDREITFYLNGTWRALDWNTGEIYHETSSAVDICAWLNTNEYKPTGVRVQ